MKITQRTLNLLCDCRGSDLEVSILDVLYMVTSCGGKGVFWECLNLGWEEW